MNVSATALAAVSQSLQKADQAAEGIAKATRPPAGAEDQVDLSEQAVRLLAARNGYDAAIGLAKTADEMSKQAIDLLA